MVLGACKTQCYNLVQTAATTQTVATSVAGASKAMAAMQGQIDPVKVNKTMQQFARENAKMDMAQEMMGDTMDDALDDAETEEETGELVSQVLDEIGVDLSAAMGSAPQRRVAQSQQAATSQADSDLDGLSARLAGLRETGGSN